MYLRKSKRDDSATGNRTGAFCVNASYPDHQTKNSLSVGDKISDIQTYMKREREKGKRDGERNKVKGGLFS